MTRSTPSLRRFSDPERLAREAASVIAKRAAKWQAQERPFRLGLTGGHTPRMLYALLAQPPWTERIDWTRIEVFFSDERCVPTDHPDSNYRMAVETLLGHVPISGDAVHRMTGEMDPELAARLYTDHIGREPLDLLLLGMGEDGHVASLFPDGPELEESERWVVPTLSPVPPRERISLTLPALNASREVLFLVAGAAKAQSLAEVMRQIDDARPRLPSARVKPAGPLRWFVDDEAANLLPDPEASR